MNKQRSRFFILLLLLSPFTTGCWDRVEIEERGTILALAIDPATKPIEDNLTGTEAKSLVPGYKLTAQVAIPGRIPLGPGGGEGGASSQKPVWVLTATGKTIADAINSLQQELAERVFLGHLRIIIVNEALAKTAGMYEIQDYLRRNAEIRRLAWLLVSRDSASAAMNASPKLERVPTLYLVSTMDHAVELGKIPNVFLGNFWSSLSSQGREPVLPLISVQGKDQIRMDGLAVFRGDRMAGVLQPLEVAAYMELRGDKRAGYSIALPMPGDPKHSVIAKGTIRKTRIKLRKEHGKPAFDVYSRVEANIEENTSRPSTNPVFVQLSEEATQTAQKGQQETLEKMKQLHTDIFGFGDYVRGMWPSYWQHIQTSQKWEEEFPNVPIRLHVRVYLRRAGMTTH